MCGGLSMEGERGTLHLEQHHGLGSFLDFDGDAIVAFDDILEVGKYKYYESKQVLPADLKVGIQLGDDHPMSKFVKCLSDSSLQESIKNAKAGEVISLPEGVVWLGNKRTFSNELFVRACYSELLEAKEEYFQLSNRKLHGVVYTGTPGIGKSHLCALVVAHKLIAGGVVFFEFVFSAEQTHKTDLYRLELASGAFSLDSLRALHFLAPDANAAYIVDGGTASSQSPFMEVQIFASPSKELYRYDAKAQGFLYLITPLFSLKEMEQCRSTVTCFTNKVTSEDVEKWFLTAGGVARTVLKLSSEGLTLDTWMDKVCRKISKVEFRELEVMLACVHLHTFAPGSDNLFHWYVAETNVPFNDNDSSLPKIALRRFKQRFVPFASGWVAQEFFIRWGLQKKP